MWSYDKSYDFIEKNLIITCQLCKILVQEMSRNSNLLAALIGGLYSSFLTQATLNVWCLVMNVQSHWKMQSTLWWKLHDMSFLTSYMKYFLTKKNKMESSEIKIGYERDVPTINRITSNMLQVYFQEEEKRAKSWLINSSLCASMRLHCNRATSIFHMNSKSISDLKHVPTYPLFHILLLPRFMTQK